ncbi:MAG: dihydroorotate dehydrogenase electron transfer subunit [Candidatus Peregrinibacteria bacterium]|nr:dihydroorotate dehydrogenase electron transfer subunit [Candidatus Peregrinibacteria bacterium]MCB9808160.1 dihydroorotate dehydrogenase electron transfer subunit [Candidatus Peribacteria bacterium]
MSSIPLQSRLPKTYRIKEIRVETDMVKTFTFDGSLGAKPGQFVMVWLPGIDEVPMSVAYDDGAETKITFFAVGEMTKVLTHSNVGDLVGLRGPFGTYYEWDAGDHIVLVAGGYGAAPMYFVASEAVKNGCTLEAIVGARGKEHLLYLEELEGLQHCSLHVSTDDGSMGHKGYNTEVLDHLLAAAAAPIDKVFACGPEMMLKSVLTVCDKHKVPCSLSLERYMKCGFGVCGNCCVDPLGIRLCTDGPVMSGDLVRNIDEFGKYHRDAEGRKHEF